MEHVFFVLGIIFAIVMACVDSIEKKYIIALPTVFLIGLSGHVNLIGIPVGIMIGAMIREKLS